MKYRFLNKIYAFINGYFWVSCRLCDKYFGGHERGINCTLYFPGDNGFGTEVCIDCKKYVKEAHFDCERIESKFDIPNSIKLTERK